MHPPPPRVLRPQRMLRPFSLCRLLAQACVCLALCAVSWQFAGAEPGTRDLASQWKYMPAGARATYIGIHGGTVPVSLLTSRDGTHMVALVGQTGNDFLRTLKADPNTAETPSLSPSALTPAPAGAESAEDLALAADEAPPTPDAAEEPDLAHPNREAAASPPPLRLGANATLLMAGTAVGTMPVIYATGHSFASLSRLYTDSLLFGISDYSPLLEGSVKAPRQAAKKNKPAKRRQPMAQASSARNGDNSKQKRP